MIMMYFQAIPITDSMELIHSEILFRMVSLLQNMAYTIYQEGRQHMMDGMSGGGMMMILMVVLWILIIILLVLAIIWLVKQIRKD